MIDKKLGFSNKIRYKISVTTGSKKDAGTSARVRKLLINVIRLSITDKRIVINTTNWCDVFK